MYFHFLFVCLCYVFVGLKGDDTINRAVNQTAEQKSMYGDHPAGLAVDGSRDGSRIPGFPDRVGQFSHTDVGSPQWWMVDLGKVFYVYRVRLWNRLRYCKFKSANLGFPLLLLICFLINFTG